MFNANKRIRARRTGTGKRAYFESTARVSWHATLLTAAQRLDVVLQLQVDNLTDGKKVKEGIQMVEGLTTDVVMPHLASYNFLIDVVVSTRGYCHFGQSASQMDGLSSAAQPGRAHRRFDDGTTDVG